MIITEELKLKSDIRARCAQIVAALHIPYEELTAEQLIKETEILFQYCMYNKIESNGN
jgi:hypothetical protein